MRRTFFIAFIMLLTTALWGQNPDYRKKARDLVAQMTLEEKASLCSGKSFWTTQEIERLGIPSIFMADGPHGLRKALGFDLSNSVPATCFPTASAMASSWDTDLVNEVGQALAREAQANDVQILLGPGVNMKRSPLGGRNFEYFSEDPVLAGKIAAAFINGVQSQGVGTSIKHFTANNQEFERMTNSSEVDMRTLHEIYLPAFEIAVKEAQPWTVMAAYNRVNGVYASEDPFLLDTILKKQWGLEGIVVSDWGAVHDRPAGVAAGLHLEMPGSGGFNNQKIVEAVQAGSLDEERLDEVVTEMVALTLKAYDQRKPDATFDPEEHHNLARKVGSESIVLLKNENDILPLDAKSIAVIGAFAKNPRYQGAGSSQVKPTQIANAYDELGKILGRKTSLTYAEGYSLETDETTDAMIAAAQEAAKKAEVAVVFAGLPDSYEAEGYDREGLDMPDSHNRLIEAVAATQPNTIVVLLNGSAVTMPWKGQVKAILEGWLGGQAGGGAIADVLTGKVNPSGKLSETFPMRLEDTPAYLEFPGQNGTSIYGEGIFIGYRYYDKKDIKPLFPFGYGLSYTTFAYMDMTVSTDKAKDTDPITVSIRVKNTGKVAGKEVVQLYIRDSHAPLMRPEKELKHFAKVDLGPGEEKMVTFELGYRDFAYFDPKVNDWQVSSGSFTLLGGGSSAELPLVATVEIEATRVRYPKLTQYSLLQDLRAHPNGQAAYEELMAALMGGRKPPEAEPAPANAEEETAKKKAEATAGAYFMGLPLYKFVYMTRGKISEAHLAELLKQVNEM